MNNYYQHHTLNQAPNLEISEDQKNDLNLNDLKTKLADQEKTKLRKNKIFKLKITITLILTHFLFFLMGNISTPNNTSEKIIPASIPSITPNENEVKLNASLILFSAFEYKEKAKWVDIYHPNGELFLSKITLIQLHQESSDENATLSNQIFTPQKYEIIIKKNDAGKVLKILNLNYHALPHGLKLPTKNKEQPKLQKKIIYKKDPFHKPWRKG